MAFQFRLRQHGPLAGTTYFTNKGSYVKYLYEFELHVPTIEGTVPRDLNVGTASRLRTLLERRKACLLKLNIPMPCPPRGTVPVNARARFSECISSQRARF